MRFSFIIPVYNRPQEVSELLESLTKQSVKDFEVIIVEDGSSNSCDEVVKKYRKYLLLKYLKKENTGPGDSRNRGAAMAEGEYLIFLDSDCIVPPSYLEKVTSELKQDVDAFGGPDRADNSFTPIQKAINYSMTSFFTTGGIRGGKKKMDKFYPRSFNLGIKKTVFEKIGGFSKMRFGEDIDLSIRIYREGFTCKLFSEAWVYHKRRTDFIKFFKQVYNSGIARVVLYKKYPDSLKLVHLLPSCFTLFVFTSICFSFYSLYSIVPLLIYCFLILIDSTIKNKNLLIGILSIVATLIQLIGYGTGFLVGWWKLKVQNKNNFSAFNNSFYD